VDDLSLFPLTSKISPSGQLTIANQSLEDLAQTYGTPLYLYDGATVTHQVSSLRSLLATHYPGKATVAYAVKAYFSLGIAKKLAAMGIGGDVVSVGEMKVAERAGFAMDGLHLHGNNKSEDELNLALDWGIQAIVVDSLDELTFLEKLAEKKKKRARIWLRVTPDLNVNTHPHIETAHAASKFGLHLADGQAAQAIRQALASPWLELVGLHTHLGSQLFDPEPYRLAIQMLYDLARKERFIPKEISPGGGWGVRYTSQDKNDSAEAWVKTVSKAVQEQCARLNWPLPTLVLEPGRWIVARAGVSVYKIGSQKVASSGTHFVAIDGGMADNPRPVLYQARYTALVVERANAAPTQLVTIVGKFCESGDQLIHEIGMPEMNRGDLLAVPVSGAYQLSMSSNYNFATRPTALWLEDGKVEVMQQREKPEECNWWTYG
jgi:diaminopimelate decarboxylase